MNFNYLRIAGITVCFLISAMTQAQLHTGSNGLFVKANTDMGINGLTLRPATDISLAENTITLSSVPVISGTPGSNGSIERVYLFDHPFQYIGELGIRYLASELNGNTGTSLQLMYKNSTTGQYGLAGLNTLLAQNLYVSGNIESQPLSISALTAADDGVALPVTFGSISAVIQNNRLIVKWQTLTEKNNSHFEIEGSADGKNFTKMGSVESKVDNGNSSDLVEYTWEAGLEVLAEMGWLAGLLALTLIPVTRKKRKWAVATILLLAGTVFYSSCSKYTDVTNAITQKYFVRIAQVDQDGHFKYSKVVEVERAE